MIGLVFSVKYEWLALRYLNKVSILSSLLNIVFSDANYFTRFHFHPVPEFFFFFSCLRLITIPIYPHNIIFRFPKYLIPNVIKACIS